MTVPTPQLGSEPSPLKLSRRVFFGGLAFGLGGATVEPLTRRGTPQLTLGPFYPLTRPSEEDADLTRITGRSGQAKGTIIDIMGLISDEAGQPVPSARIDTWQTNGLGAYHHPSDESGKPHDPNFQGTAVFNADAKGEFWMRTVMPQPYAKRERHIHFDIRGKNRRLMTQMFFPGEPNDRDFLYNSLRTAPLQAAVTAVLTTRERNPGIPLYLWNVRLAGESPNARRKR